MKKKNILLYGIITILILLIVGITIYAFLGTKKENIHYKKGVFYSIEKKEEESIGNKVYTKEEEFVKDFPDEVTDDFDFDLYSYVLIEIPINTCGEKNFKPVGYLQEDDKLIVHFTYTSSCGVCPPEYEYYLLLIDKSLEDYKVEATYEATNDPHCDPTVAYKPIIYIYPEEEKEIEIKISNKENLLFTYPKYNDGWKVTAKPNGSLISNNKEYYALFWEGTSKYTSIKDEGFVVKGIDTESFLEEKLTILGLNYKERNEFIIYWLPKLEQNPYNYIYFESLEEINNYMSLSINPEPNNLIRIQMDYKPLDKEIKIKEQVLTTPSREGYTIVEWGGSEIK